MYYIKWRVLWRWLKFKHIRINTQFFTNKFQFFGGPPSYTHIHTHTTIHTLIPRDSTLILKLTYWVPQSFFQAVCPVSYFQGRLPHKPLHMGPPLTTDDNLPWLLSASGWVSDFLTSHSRGSDLVPTWLPSLVSYNPLTGESSSEDGSYALTFLHGLPGDMPFSRSHLSWVGPTSGRLIWLHLIPTSSLAWSLTFGK